MIADLLTGIGLAFTPKGVRNSILEVPEQYSFADPATWERLLGGHRSDAGVRVNHHIALELAAVWQVATIISGDIASMPLGIFKENAETGWHELDWSNPAQKLVSIEANDETSAFEFWRRIVFHAFLYGNGYGYIGRTSRFGPPQELVNLLPDRTAPMRRASGELYYTTEVDGELEPLFKEEMFHLKGPSIDNSRGIDMIHKARNAIGLALAAEGYSSKFFANGAQAAGILMIPAAFTEKAAQKLEEGYRDRTQKENWFKTLILRDGAKFESVSIDAQKAQLHELREDQVREVARFANMPGFKVNIQDSMAYNSAEMAQQVYLTGCLLHWMKAIQSEAHLKFLDRSQRYDGSHKMKHDSSVLLQPDAQTLNEILASQRQNEIINANEYRLEIGRNPRKDPGGEEYSNPNVKSAPQPGDKPEPDDDPAPVPPKPSKKPPKQLQDAIHGSLVESVNRVARRVCFDARNHAKKPAKFVQWLDGGALEHRAVFAEATKWPLMGMGSMLDASPAALEADLSGRFFAALLTTLKEFVDPPHKADDLATNVESACTYFEATIADKLCQQFIEPEDMESAA